MAAAALSQTWMATAPLIAAEYYRIAGKYGKRGVRYAIVEAGHIGQNILLQSEAMGLGAGVVGAFNDDKVRQVVNIPTNHIYTGENVMPKGKKKAQLSKKLLTESSNYGAHYCQCYRFSHKY